MTPRLTRGFILASTPCTTYIVRGLVDSTHLPITHLCLWYARRPLTSPRRHTRILRSRPYTFSTLFHSSATYPSEPDMSVMHPYLSREHIIMSSELASSSFVHPAGIGMSSSCPAISATLEQDLGSTFSSPGFHGLVDLSYSDDASDTSSSSGRRRALSSCSSIDMLPASFFRRTGGCW